MILVIGRYRELEVIGLPVSAAGVFEAHQYRAEGEFLIADTIMRLRKVFWQESLCESIICWIDLATALHWGQSPVYQVENRVPALVPHLGRIDELHRF